MSKTYTVPEVLSEIAKSIKAQVAEHEAGLTALRQKELQRSHGVLAKSELCPLCATPDDASGRCACLHKSEGLNKDQMSANYATKIGVSGPHSKAKAGFGDGPHDQRPGKPQSEMGKLNGVHDSSVPKIKMNKDEMGGDSSMMMSEGCPECGGVGSHPNTCSTALKNPKTIKKMELSTTPKKGGNETGSGGETKKVPLKKSMIPSGKKPAVQGVAGKQPVGQGGGDAGKIAGAPHPDTTAALADVKGLSPASKWGGQGLPQLKGQLAAVRGGSAWLKTTHAAAHRVHPAQAAPPSQRFQGALPLQRSEKEPDKKPEEIASDAKPCPRHIVCGRSCTARNKPNKKLLTKMEDLGKCAMCKSEEHPGKCK
jgi:hypothetical protein